jgi:hypothetical protein
VPSQCCSAFKISTCSAICVRLPQESRAAPSTCEQDIFLAVNLSSFFEDYGVPCLGRRYDDGKTRSFSGSVLTRPLTRRRTPRVRLSVLASRRRILPTPALMAVRPYRGRSVAQALLTPRAPRAPRSRLVPTQVLHRTVISLLPFLAVYSRARKWFGFPRLVAESRAGAPPLAGITVEIACLKIVCSPGPLCNRTVCRSKLLTWPARRMPFTRKIFTPVCSWTSVSRNLSCTRGASDMCSSVKAVDGLIVPAMWVRMWAASSRTKQRQGALAQGSSQ